MIAWENKRTAETREIEKRLGASFPSIGAYRQNSASIRVRIVDERFAGKSIAEREDLVLPLIQELPEDTQSDITVLLMLTPGEQEASLMNQEFDCPMESSI